MTAPLLDLVRLDGVDQVATAVLQRDGVAMIVIHFGEQIRCIGIERNDGVFKYAKRMQLSTKSSASDDELCGICATTLTLVKAFC